MRVGIVNDQPSVIESLQRVLSLVPEHQLIWTARDGAEAIDLCERDRPDLLLMNLIMPGMDGVEATKRIMARAPCAILIVTTDIENNAARIFAAMGQGALDAVEAPLLGPSDIFAAAKPLLTKIAALRSLIQERTVPRKGGSLPQPQGSTNSLVAIGASAGGPAALATVLKGLPQNFPAPIIIVQHVDARFVSGLVEWLGQLSLLPVSLAREGDRAVPGEVMIAGADNHLIFKSKGRLGYTAQPADHLYQPSVDVFLHSAARHWSGPVVGVLLTGMGSDGAQGLKALRMMGHHTIAQDQATSAVYGMPKAAASISAAVEILPLERIALRLTELLAPAHPRRGLSK